MIVGMAFQQAMIVGRFLQTMIMGMDFQQAMILGPAVSDMWGSE